MLAVLVSKQRYLITAFNGTPPPGGSGCWVFPPGLTCHPSVFLGEVSTQCLPVPFYFTF